MDNDGGSANKWSFENWEILFGSRDLSKANAARIIGIAVHDEFNSSTLKNDIALLKLDRRVASPSQIACIPSTNYNIDKGSTKS